MTSSLMACLGAVWQALVWHNLRMRAQAAALLEEYQLVPSTELVRTPGLNHPGGAPANNNQQDYLNHQI
jgi:hypothetical protein